MRGGGVYNWKRSGSGIIRRRGWRGVGAGGEGRRRGRRAIAAKKAGS